MAETVKHPILLVDDEPEILFSLRGLLRKEFEVYTAASAAEALTILEKQPVDVIMTDQRMPEMTGVQLLSRVRHAHPEAVRIVFTGYADIKAVIDALNEGHIYRYITKPWDPDELRAVLHQACAEHDRLQERFRLLNDLRSYVGQCVPVLQSGSPELAATGSELLTRLDAVLRGPGAKS